ncbi:Transcriptional regulator, ArsR family [hydrothermal vent metagenome]|uniref:Transcriptional regulator, ArsR family n=1 Tax=hydrothermal vent metagenome TaxID=652676 RepID=A0A3B0RFF8_9ZZZZ
METEQASEIFSALGQATRLEILKIIAPHSRGDNPPGLPAGEIGKALSLPPATLSFHLKDMNYKGLVVTRREGRKIYYRANLPVLLDTLEELITHVLEPAGAA